MSRPLQELQRFFRELKRRNVYKVAVAYAVVGFVLIQAADLIFPALHIPSWAYSLVVVLILFGFPIALIVAWAFELTPEGVRRTADAEPGAPVGEGPEELETSSGGTGTAYQVLIALGLVAGAVAGGWYLTGGGDSGADTRAAAQSIAVLPFDNLSGADDAQPFVNGIHDDLLTRLSNISELEVISRTSVLPYRETELSLPAIADSLGVRWIVEGGVQQAGGQVQVNAQLIQAEDDVHRWAKTYRRELTTENLFDVQAELTKRIARSLEAQLTPEETERVERRPTDDLEAYRLYVRGRSHLDRRTEQGIRGGMELFEQAIERDSAYALAWAGVADARALLASYGYAPGDSLFHEARDAAERALELESDLAEAHASLGLILQDLRRDGPGALRELRRAVELKPSYARAHHWLGNLLETLGQHGRAGAPLKRAAELDPLSPPIHVTLSGWYYHADSLERALEEARRTRRLSPGYPSGPLYEAIVLSRLGRQEQAIAALRTVLDEMDIGPQTRNGALAWLAIAHHRAGDTARARTLIDRLEGEGADFSAAAVRADMGDRDAALSRLSRTQFDYVRTVFLRYDPVFDPLRGDPRFQELLREVNRSWGLNPDGTLPEGVDVTFDPQAGE